MPANRNTSIKKKDNQWRNKDDNQKHLQRPGSSSRKRKKINKHHKGRGREFKNSKAVIEEKKAARLEAKMLARLKDTSKETTANLISNKSQNIITQVQTKKKRKKDSGSNKMSIPTNSKDYGGSLNIPEKVEQRKYETTGQFFARLNRMVAKAKVEANMGARFNVNL